MENFMDLLVVLKGGLKVVLLMVEPAHPQDFQHPMTLEFQAP
jgi:hypothetical protein